MTGTQSKKNSLVKIANTSCLIKFEQYNDCSSVVRFQESHVPSRSNIPSTDIQETTTDSSLIRSSEKPAECKIESKKSEQT